MSAELLESGTIEILGRVPDASNSVWLATVTQPGTHTSIAAVVKPTAGERPLRDFPPATLAHREVASYRLSEVLGLGIVPPTVLRTDLPWGTASVQAWVEHDEDRRAIAELFPADDVPESHIPVFYGETADGTPLALAHESSAAAAVFAFFDVIANNADRKASHVIFGTPWPGDEASYHGIDHGLTFHPDYKLRTVLWGFAGADVPRQLLDRLGDGTEEALREALDELLSEGEIEALQSRIARLRASGKFPHPAPGHPAIPWPPD